MFSRFAIARVASPNLLCFTLVTSILISPNAPGHAFQSFLVRSSRRQCGHNRGEGNHPAAAISAGLCSFQPDYAHFSRILAFNPDEIEFQQNSVTVVMLTHVLQLGRRSNEIV
jgi:hypothetical protein